MRTTRRKILSIAHVFTLLVTLQNVHSWSPPNTSPSSTIPKSLSVTQFHQQYADLPEGKHLDQRVSVDVVVREIKATSPRLVFLRAAQSACSQDKDGINVMELLLRERDSFLTTEEIAQVVTHATTPGAATLHCCGFPERLASFDGPSFFPHLNPPPAQPVCLHVTAVNVTLLATTGGKVVEICPIERVPMAPNNKAMPGRMPPLLPNKSSGNRGGGGNRDRGGIFAAWAIDKFGLLAGPAEANVNILDIAGGSGQLAFQLGVRRGFNVTVVDPRELRLASDQQRTLQYHRQQGLRLLPPGETKRNPDLPASEYGHHFGQVQQQITNNHNDRDRTFLVGGQAQVRHLALYFDSAFTMLDAWKDCSIVLGMHPDEATEDLVDLALQHNKPFAVVPCCVFWKRDPQRRTPSGKQVRTWEQFCDYLEAKDETRIQKETLPFPGRKTVLYSMGSMGSRK